MHFILIDLIRYLWRGRDLQTLLAVATQLTAAVKLSLQSFVTIIIIALFCSALAAWILPVPWILIGSQGGAISPGRGPTLNKWKEALLSGQGPLMGGHGPIRGPD